MSIFQLLSPYRVLVCRMNPIFLLSSYQHPRMSNCLIDMNNMPAVNFLARLDLRFQDENSLDTLLNTMIHV